MTRTLNEIRQAITADLQTKFPALSKSDVAEWRLWTFVVAAAIHSFEVILELFRSEVERTAHRSIAGTAEWYAEVCRRFQYGHTLVYDPRTAAYDYPTDDPAARIVRKVAISVHERTLYVKVARQDDEDRMIPLSDAQRQDFTAYLQKKAFAGTPVGVISTTADQIRYRMEVYYDPVYPQQTVRDQVLEMLEAFRTSQSFDAKFYPQQWTDRVMSVPGVVTVSLAAIEHRTSAQGAEYEPVGVVAELAAGYFDYDRQGSELTLKTAR